MKHKAILFRGVKGIILRTFNSKRSFTCSNSRHSYLALPPTLAVFKTTVFLDHLLRFWRVSTSQTKIWEKCVHYGLMGEFWGHTYTLAQNFLYPDITVSRNNLVQTTHDQFPKYLQDATFKHLTSALCSLSQIIVTVLYPDISFSSSQINNLLI